MSATGRLVSTPSTGHAQAPSTGRGDDVGAAVLDCRGLTKRFGGTLALDDVDLQVNRGETLAVMGPSGCGKSTLLRTLAGLTGIDAGSIALQGRQVAGDARFVPAEDRGVGIVFQDLALFPHLTVADNVAFGLQPAARRRASWSSWRRRRIAARDAVGSAAPTRVEEMLGLVGMRALANRYPHELSGGEQQRVAIARALAPDPVVMLLDEPFSHLDRHLAVQVRDEAMQVLRSAGATVLVVTHDQDEALAVGDRVAVLRAGRLVQVDTPEGLFNRPTDRFVATLLGEADFVRGTRRGAWASSFLGELPVMTGPDGAVHVMVRPHDLTVQRSGCHDTASGGLGVVSRVEFRGGDVLHHVSLDDGTSVRARTSHTRAVPVGARVIVPTPVAHPLAAFTAAELHA